MTLNIKEYDKILLECRKLSIIKNNNYGNESLKRFGNKGLFIRISDKIDRLHNLLWLNKENSIKDELIDDTLKDIINYCVYIIMLKNNKLEVDNETKND